MYISPLFFFIPFARKTTGFFVFAHVFVFVFVTLVHARQVTISLLSTLTLPACHSVHTL